jgi:hypothetical protein
MAYCIDFGYAYEDSDNFVYGIKALRYPHTVSIEGKRFNVTLLCRAFGKEAR